MVFSIADADHVITVIGEMKLMMLSKVSYVVFCQLRHGHRPTLYLFVTAPFLVEG
jgi:hypothetical protein